MSKTKDTYNLTRNQEIYDDYVNNNMSYNQLAKKYDLSPQRIQAIVYDFQDKGLQKKLDPKDKIKTREEFKDKAVELREQGNLKIALNMFEQVAQWDNANNNIEGLVDVLGHIRITNTLLANETKDKTTEMQYRIAALEAIKQAIDVSTKDKSVSAGSKAILQVHYVSAVLQKTKAEKGKVDKKELEEALKQINEAIDNLPGSKAHKAWPANNKARILYELGKTEDALKTLCTAENWLAEGYFEQIKENQGEIKLNVWKTGLDIARAEILIKENKPILAKHYLNAVISMPDPEGYLTERKKEAKRMLKEIK